MAPPPLHTSAMDVFGIQPSALGWAGSWDKQVPLYLLQCLPILAVRLSRHVLRSQQHTI